MKKIEQENYGLHALQSLELVLKNQQEERLVFTTDIKAAVRFAEADP